MLWFKTRLGIYSVVMLLLEPDLSQCFDSSVTLKNYPQASATMTPSRHTVRRRFGQHWLRDATILDQIICAAKLTPEDRILEIGPGRGALTKRLLDSPADIIHTIELDYDLANRLQRRFRGNPRFSLREGDALSVPLELPDGDSATKVVANIPYNITGPLLERLLGKFSSPTGTVFRRLVLLIQREVAERIRAQPGSSSFNAMSVRMQLTTRCFSVCVVPSHCFQPPPKVQSEVIVLEPLPRAQRPNSNLALRVDYLLHKAFQTRRKMLRNTLLGIAPIEELHDLANRVGICLNQRPQELEPRTWLSLAEELTKVCSY